ncbi:hypothetical protein [Streptomyces rubellomurinus]|uniref:hypothetical protein n=1 Tax=Streptomyces rubellomurinus (strain ATCC 31215) TaxID=359131 RepID=UPI000B0F160B|nr:hypothetical protein [Streptomyces rubellomurinus]
MTALVATGHPLQRAGAWAVAVIAERDDPDRVSPADLDTVSSVLVADVLTAAAAPKGSGRYDWWKVLFALYPNSKATHSKRPSDRDVLRPDIEQLFAPDSPQAAPVRPCTFCHTGTAAVWAKTNLPLFDTNKALNTLPPGVPGWPVCRGCRIAMWALPYGAWVTAGSATVLSCEEPSAEREFARRNVRRARRVMQAGFTGLPAGTRPERVVLAALRDASDGLCATTLWSFKNDNQEPWLRVTRTRRAVPVFLATVDGNAPLRRGWHLLCRALARPDAGKSAEGEAARLLFEAEDGRSRPLLGQLHRLLAEVDDSWSAADREALVRLAFTYAEEVFGMETDLEPVATLIVDWIARGSSPRGLLAEYRKAALSDYELGSLLVKAYTRLQLDGSTTPLAGPELWKPLIQRQPRAWEQRMLLFAQVSVMLQQRGVVVSGKEADPRREREIEELADRPAFAPGREDDEYDGHHHYETEQA